MYKKYIFFKDDITPYVDECEDINEYNHVNRMIQEIKPTKQELLSDIGSYSTYKESPMSFGQFQFDLWDIEGKHDYSLNYDWNVLIDKIGKGGIRNSLLVAPMPTASTSQILGNNECIEPYLIELNNLGPNFETDKYKWKVLFGKWSFTVKDTAGDINLDYMLRDKIRSIHFVDTLPISSYSKDSPEVTLLGWLAYNDAQHSYMMRKANVNEDEDEAADMLTLEDIKIIANFFLELWRTAVDQSFKGKGGNKKKDKRENREKYLDKIEELQDTCSPYGKTYIEFGACIQSRMLELENLGKETGKDILYGESLDNVTIDKLYN